VEDPLAHSWFHAIDLGDGTVTPGRFRPEVPPNYTLYGVFELLAHLDLGDARCFDVGTMDGIVSWVLAGLGAREVIGCDMAPRKTWHIAREALGLEVGYRTPVNALELPTVVGGERADLIVLSGILYHVYDPLTVLVACREAIRRNGFLIVETAYLYDEGSPRMLFNPTDDSPRAMVHSNVYWRPSKRTVHGMLELAGFEVISTLAVDGRLTVLAQAKRPSEIRSRAPRVAFAQDRNPHRHYREAANFQALSNDDRPPARIRYEGPTEDRFIYRALWEPMVPYQPRWEPPSEMTRLEDLARSARMHAATRAAEARAATVRAARRGLRRLIRR
jgi:SAM-dependent methyltransferase